MLATLIFLLLFAFLDRLSGGWPQVPGRGQYYTPIVVIPAAMILGLGPLIGLWITLAFMAWRMPAWGFLGGSLAPFPYEYLGTFLRHLWGSLMIFLAWISSGKVMELTPIAYGWLIVFPAVALALAIYNREEADKERDVNAGVELSRGAVFGIAMSIPFN